jgi:hypothetical protein
MSALELLFERETLPKPYGFYWGNIAIAESELGQNFPQNVDNATMRCHTHLLYNNSYGNNIE